MMDLSTLNGILALLVLPYTFLTGRLHTRIVKLQERADQMYTKKETKELIELIITPIQSSLDRLITSQDNLTTALHKLELKIANEANYNRQATGTKG